MKATGGGTNITAPEPQELANGEAKERENPLLSRRVVNAYARMSGCREGDPAAPCEHRHYARKALTELIGLVEVEQP